MFWKRKRNKSTFRCAECGETHSDWPAIVHPTPDHYSDLSDAEKDEIAEFTRDYCVIHHEDQTDRFISATLRMNVVDSEETLDYGVWVSLSEQSYEDYLENFDNENHEAQYFGWLVNWIDGYENTQAIPMTVITQSNNERPLLYPHKDHDHQLVRDVYDGISAHEAQRRVDKVLGAQG